MISRFSRIKAAPPIELFALNEAYERDTHPNKVNLGIEAYRTDEGNPWVLPVVRKIEKDLAEDETVDHEYPGIYGMKDFSDAASRLLLGEDSPAIEENRILAIQTVSGTGGLRLDADFLSHCVGFTDFYMPEPTLPEHRLVFMHAGFKNFHTYRYWSTSKLNLDFEGMLEDLEKAPENSVVLLHACAHNPTGVDPTEEQWKQIADLMERKKLLPFFDCSYQGFASGDLVKDGWTVRYFISRGFELICSQSFSNNFGLYNERVGNLIIVVKEASVITNSRAQIALLICGNYLHPPSHGAQIVTKILNDPAVFKEWQGHIKEMSGRIIQMRQALKQKLDELKTPGTWDHITGQVGMFSYTGLSQLQVKYLTEKYHIYLPQDGRIGICGLNTKNVDYVAKAIHDSVVKYKEID